MNNLILKQTIILSAILGVALGVITLIPFMRGFSFLILILCASALVIVYMKRHELIGVITIQEGAMLGAVSGFVSFITFSIAFIPLVSIVGLIFKSYYTFGIPTLFSAGGFFVMILLVIFAALLSALMNAFAGLTTAYVYEFLSGVKEEEAQAEHVEFEIKD